MIHVMTEAEWDVFRKGKDVCYFHTCDNSSFRLSKLLKAKLVCVVDDDWLMAVRWARKLLSDEFVINVKMKKPVTTRFKFECVVVL